MEIKDILTLINAVSESRLSSFTYEEGGIKLSMEARCQAVTVQNEDNEPVNKIKKEEENPSKEEKRLVITSPMVGTFYASGEDGMEPFVAVGEAVKKGQVVGIIEAMKLMNEVESPFDGVIEAILVKNKDMVGYGQELMRIKPM